MKFTSVPVLSNLCNNKHRQRLICAHVPNVNGRLAKITFEIGWGAEASQDPTWSELIMQFVRHCDLREEKKVEILANTSVCGP